ncbi:hypothetical protein V5O48_015873 [Marasmius crinis-equi]|uniref:Uncharacterized protein n=1 Tax=Marasmius crinis-equi TaxID=585013 RepID=A0ABR3ETD7_9AGAR
MEADLDKHIPDVHYLSRESSFAEKHPEGFMREHAFGRYIESRQDDPQVSLTLDPKVVSKVVEEDSGTEKTGFSNSLVSSNNFINYCATVPLPLTNGSRFLENGSCNPAPIGSIPAAGFISSTKFKFPVNRGTLAKGVPFLIQLTVNLQGLDTNTAINDATSYQAAPQQLDSSGLIKRDTFIVLEALSTIDQTTVPNPLSFNFIASRFLSPPFLSFNVIEGLQEGVYRLSSVTRGMNFQSSIVFPVVDHGAIDDAIYFTVTADGKPSTKVKRSIDINNPIFARQTGNTTTSISNSAAQSSTTLLVSQIATAFASDGQNKTLNDQSPSSQTSPSLTSRNNFINYCLTVPASLTNGQQRRGSGGPSCNPIPIGAIPAISAIPAFKFIRPGNFDRLDPGKPFLIILNYKNMVISMTDPDTRYLSAPQRLDSNGMIRGYARVVIEALTSLDQTNPTDPTRIAYASPLTDQDGTGTLVTNATSGLPVGFYRLSSVALTENHYPVALPVDAHGAINDIIYFQVGDGGSGSTAANSIIITANGQPTSLPVGIPFLWIKGVNLPIYFLDSPGSRRWFTRK